MENAHTTHNTVQEWDNLQMLGLFNIILLALTFPSVFAFQCRVTDVGLCSSPSCVTALRSSRPSTTTTVSSLYGPPKSPPSTEGLDEPANSPATSPKVQRLHSINSFLTYLDDAPENSLSVIKFFAKTCPLCRKIDIKYKKMAHFYQTAAPMIRFAEIDKAVHTQFCATLGVDRFPFIQIYRNGQCVASHGADSEKTFGPLVNDTIQRELSMTPEDWDAFLRAFAEPIRVSTTKVDNVRLLLHDP